MPFDQVIQNISLTRGTIAAPFIRFLLSTTFPPLFLPRSRIIRFLLPTLLLPIPPMAVATESFSIREYAGKMRSLDYDKCWPFGAERGGQSLPPMPVRKFRWWADELLAVRSVGEVDDRVDFQNKATVQVQAADGREAPVADADDVVRGACDGEALVEEKQLRTPSRPKQRTPKKRSILELFAVAPPINGIQEQKRDAGGGSVNQQIVASAAAADSNLGVGGRRDSLESRKRKKRSKDGGKMLKEKIWAKKKLKTKTKLMKKKKRRKVEIRAAKKEKICKLKVSSPVDLFKILKHRACEKHFTKIQNKLVHRQTNPTTIRNLLKKHIFRLVRSSKLAPSNQEISRMPINSFAKKRKRGTSSQRRNKLEIRNDSNVVERYNDSTKHLSFSGADTGLANGNSPLGLPHVETLCKIVPDVLVGSSTMENSNRCSSVTEGTQLNLKDKETTLNLKGKEIIITRTVELDETTSEAELNGCFSQKTTTNPITKRPTMVENLDLNNPVNDYVDLNCITVDGSSLITSLTHSSDQNVVGPINKVRLDPDTGTCWKESFSLISDHVNSLRDPFGKLVSVPDRRSEVSMIRNQDRQHRISCLERSCIGSTDGRAACIGLPEFQQMCRIPKNAVISTCSSVNPDAIVEQSAILGTIWKDKRTEEGFVGLPLNSQGELIQLQPGTRYGFSEIDKMSNSALNSFQNFPCSSHVQSQSNHTMTKGKFPFTSSYHDNGQNWLLKHHPPRKVVLSDFSSLEFQGLEKMNNQTYGGKAQFSGCDPSQMEYYCCGCSDHIVTENCFGRMKFCSDVDLELGARSAIQPTLRLMGKNVTVGSCSKEHHGCNDGKAWTDKETLNTSYPTIRVYNKPFFKRWHEQNCSVEAEHGASRGTPLKSLAFPSNCCCMSEDKLTLNCRHLGFGSDWMLHDGYSPSKGDRGFHIDLTRSPVQCQSFLNRGSHLAVNCSPEAHLVDIGQQRTRLQPYPQNFCQHLLVNSTNCKHSQSVSFSIPSTSRSPYINQMPTQTSRCQSIPKPPYWMQDSTNQQLHFIPYSTAAYQPCNIPANGGFPHPAPYSRPLVSFPSNSNISSQTYVSYVPTSVVYPASVTALAAHNFISASATYRDKINAKDSMDYPKGCRKRSASYDEKIIGTVKRSNLTVQEDSNCPSSVRREQLHGEKDNMEASEVIACVSRTADDSFPTMDSEVVSGGLFPFKSCHTRSGPVKLSAGAKHILRPNGNLDQENCRPIYTTVPFTQGTISGKDANPHEKATKVYRF